MYQPLLWKKTMGKSFSENPLNTFSLYTLHCMKKSSLIEYLVKSASLVITKGIIDRRSKFIRRLL